MALILTSVQCYAIGIIIFGFIGFLRGWRREVVSMGFILAAVLFLYVGGANGMAYFFLGRIPYGAYFLTGGAIGPSSLPPPPGPTQVLITAIVTLLVAMFLGFIVGNNAFKAPGSAPERFIGIIPGLVEGFALVAYISHLFASSPQIEVGTNTPSPSSLGNGIVVVFLVAIVALIIGLVAGRLGKKSGGK
jgi:hypothetical protein